MKPKKANSLYVVSSTNQKSEAFPTDSEMLAIKCDGVYGGNIFNRVIWWIGYADSDESAILQAKQNWKENYETKKES